MKNIEINTEMIKQILKGTAITIAAIGTGAMIVKSNPKMDCEIEEAHAHVYTNEDGFTTYRIDEHQKSNGGLRWTDQTTDITDEITIMDKNKLLLISENRELLNNVVENSTPYLQYEYKTTRPQRVGKVTVSSTVRRFTNDPNENRRYTDRGRTVTAMYRGYRIVTNTKGKQVLEESPWVEDITLLEDMYPYFKLKDYKKWFYSNVFELDKNKELQLEYE